MVKVENDYCFRFVAFLDESNDKISKDLGWIVFLVPSHDWMRC